MKKTWKNKTRFHDWLLINALKHRDDTAIPEGFIVSNEEREAIEQRDAEEELALLARVAKKKYPSAGKRIGLSNVLLWISPVPVFLVLYTLFSSGTLSGVEKLDNGDTGVNLGLFVASVSVQYIVLIGCLVLWAIYFLREATTLVLGRTDKNKQSSPFSLMSWLCNPIGTAVIATHWLGVATFAIRKRNNLSFIDFAEQYQNKPRVLQLLANTFAQAFWFILALITIGLFVWSSFGVHNHFYWRDSVTKTDERLYWIQTIQFFTYRGQLTDEEILAVTLRGDPSRNLTIPVEVRSDERVKWTRFMVCALALPLVVRFVLFALIRFFYILSQRDFKPDPQEEFYRNLIEKIIEAGDTVKGERETTETEEEEIPVKETIAPPIIAQGPPKTLIFMYDVDISETFWQEIFPHRSRREIYGIEQCKSEEGEQVQHRIKQGEVAVENIIFAFDLTDVPIVGKLTFVKNIAGALGDKTFVLLSRSEALRRQKNNDSSAMADRRREWTVKLERAGVPSEHIIDYFDHEINDAKTRKRLAELFRGNQEDFQLAGKYVEASEIILTGVQEIFNEFEKHPQSFASASWDVRPVVDDRLRSYRDKISHLYAEEGQKLRVSVGLWNANLDLTGIQKDAEGMFGTASEKIQQFGNDTLKESIAWGLWLGRVQKTLKRRSVLSLGGTILGTASVGVALAGLGPVAAMAAPYVVSVCGGAGGILGFFAPEMSKGVFQMSKGVLRREFQKDSDDDDVMSEADANFRVEVSMFIVSLATWALVHELQGLSPDDLAERLSCVLVPIETASVDSLATVRQAFGESQRVLLSQP